MSTVLSAVSDPAAGTQIFDRIDVVAAIRDVWLAGGGESGVLICAHKSGKSFLLEHIYKSLGSPDLIFCWVNLDVMRAEHGSQRGPLDQIFLKQFLRRLELGLLQWIDEQTFEHRETQQQLTVLQDRNNGLDPAAADFAERKKLLRESMVVHSRAVRDFENVKAAYREIVAALSQQPIVISDIASIVERLRIARKRIALLIDDYHIIVKERAISDSMLSLLRGASSEGTITIVASSPISLMDKSLHEGDDDRIAKFNHFRAHVLRPFREEQAHQFLEWLTRGPPLAQENRQYLYDMCGGSPYLLRNARELFVQRGSPGSVRDREEFERDTLRNFEPALRSIFSRCSDARQEILRNVASGAAIQTNSDVRELLDDGYLVEVLGGYAISSRLLRDFIRRQPPGDPFSGVSASVQISHNVFPTALAYADPKSPIVTFQLVNRSTSRVAVQLSCRVHNLSDPYRSLVELRPGETRSVPVAVLLLTASVQNLVNPSNASLEYSAEIGDRAGQGRLLVQEMIAIRVMPIDYFTFAYSDPSLRVITSSAWLIAAWIINSDKSAEKIRKKARDTIGEFRGYPESGDPEPVRQIVEALYGALKAHGLQYDSSALVFHRNECEFAQRVRRPGLVLEHKGANCLEGCALFASLLHASDLHPLILFVPGHAVVGWKDSDTGLAGWNFLETTSIQTDAFEVACSKGQARYVEVKSLCDAWLSQQPSAEIHDTSRFAIVVDIHEIQKTRMLAILPSPD